MVFIPSAKAPLSNVPTPRVDPCSTSLSTTAPDVGSSITRRCLSNPTNRYTSSWKGDSCEDLSAGPVPIRRDELRFGVIVALHSPRLFSKRRTYPKTLRSMGGVPHAPQLLRPNLAGLECIRPSGMRHRAVAKTDHALPVLDRTRNLKPCPRHRYDRACHGGYPLLALSQIACPRHLQRQQPLRLGAAAEDFKKLLVLHAETH